MQQKQLNVADEFASLGDALNKLISDIRAKKSATQIATDVFPGLMQAVMGMDQMIGDIKLVDNQVYIIKSIADAFEPAVAAKLVSTGQPAALPAAEVQGVSDGK